MVDARTAGRDSWRGRHAAATAGWHAAATAAWRAAADAGSLSTQVLLDPTALQALVSDWRP